MTIRIKTVEYWLGSSNTTLATGVRRDLTQVAVRLPETSNVFRSVRLILGVMDAQATAASMTNPVLGVQIDAIAFNNATLGNPPGNSGEHASYVFERDVTSYFQTNFTTAQHNVGVGFQFTGPTVINICAKLIITYEYDDTSSEHVKTVRIPIESLTAGLTATLASVGSNQIPLLDTFLPEATKTYRRVWVEAIYNDQAVGTVNDPTLGISISGSAEQVTGAHFTDLASARAELYYFDQGASPAFVTASCNLQARSSTITTAATFHHAAFVLYVTYTFEPVGTTRVLNSLVLSLPSIDFPGATVANTDASERMTTLYIQEPGTITLRQSGALIYYSQTAAVSPRIRFGSQAERTYTDTNVLYCGASFLTHRIDPSGSQGAGITLARGENTIEWAVSVATLGISPSSFSGMIYLNYESNTSSLGVGAHNQSTLHSVQDSLLAATTYVTSSAQRIYQPSPEWFRNDLGFSTNQVLNAASNTFITFEAESTGSEKTGGGWENIASLPLVGETEVGWYPQSEDMVSTHPGKWTRWSGDVDTSRMHITGSRRLRLTSGVTSTRPLIFWTTMHNITYAVSSSISGSSGGAVTASLYNAIDGTKLKTTSRIGTGSIAFTWYDNTQEVFVEARETNNLVGRSGNGTATGTP